jgi:hypothetical protein
VFGRSPGVVRTGRGPARNGLSLSRSNPVPCIEMGVGLLTLNQKDFSDFAEHEGLVLLGEAL